MRRIALLTVLAFGCATTRPPEMEFPAQLTTPRIALAEPQLELWMEGTGPIDPHESEGALAQSREALAEAVAGRGLDAPDPEQLLVVRARAIARTAERRSAQVWSTVFIVFVVVAVVVTTILLSRSKSGPRTSAPAGHGVLPAPGAGVRRFGPGFVPRPYPPPPPIGLYLGFSVVVPSEPLPPVPWIQPSEAWLASRGWFDGDALELTVELTDPHTGQVSWHHTVRESADPRDPVAVSALLDRALAGQPFGWRATPIAPREDAPPAHGSPSEAPLPQGLPSPPEELPPPPPGAPGDGPPAPPQR